jgi:hypothetical protein
MSPKDKSKGHRSNQSLLQERDTLMAFMIIYSLVQACCPRHPPRDFYFLGFSKFPQAEAQAEYSEKNP